MRPSLLVLFALALACDHPASSPIVDAAAADVSVVDSETFVEAEAPLPLPPKSCDDLSDVEKDALERCAMTRIKLALGYRGAIMVRVDMNGVDVPTIRSENDIEPWKFRPTPAGGVCDQSAKVLAAHLPCKWDVRGPFPAFVIKTVH